MQPSLIFGALSSIARDIVKTVSDAVSSGTKQDAVPAPCVPETAAQKADDKPSEAAYALRAQFAANVVGGVARNPNPDLGNKDKNVKQTEASAEKVKAAPAPKPMVYGPGFARLIERSEGAKELADKILVKVEKMAQTAADDIEKAVTAYHELIKKMLGLNQMIYAMNKSFGTNKMGEMDEPTLEKMMSSEENRTIFMAAAMDAIEKVYGSFAEKDIQTLCMGEYAILLLDRLKSTHPETITRAQLKDQTMSDFLLVHRVVFKHFAQDYEFRRMQYDLNRRLHVEGTNT